MQCILSRVVTFEIHVPKFRGSQHAEISMNKLTFILLKLSSSPFILGQSLLQTWHKARSLQDKIANLVNDAWFCEIN